MKHANLTVRCALQEARVWAQRANEFAEQLQEVVKAIARLDVMVCHATVERRCDAEKQVCLWLSRAQSAVGTAQREATPCPHAWFVCRLSPR